MFSTLKTGVANTLEKVKATLNESLDKASKLPFVTDCKKDGFGTAIGQGVEREQIKAKLNSLKKVYDVTRNKDSVLYDYDSQTINFHYRKIVEQKRIMLENYINNQENNIDQNDDVDSNADSNADLDEEIRDKLNTLIAPTLDQADQQIDQKLDNQSTQYQTGKQLNDQSTPDQTNEPINQSGDKSIELESWLVD
jgi:hypothetical protein